MKKLFLVALTLFTFNASSGDFFSAFVSGIEGEVEGHAVVIPVESKILKTILRKEYKLLDQQVLDKKFHPLLMLFFKFTNVRPKGPHFSLPLVGPSYSSVYILAPYTSLQNQAISGEYTVMPRGFMNDRLMVAASRSFNGLPKEYAQIITASDRFEVFQKSSLLFSAQFSKADPSLDGLDAEEIKKMINMKTISDRPFGSLHFGTSGATIDWENVNLVSETAEVFVDHKLFSELGDRAYLLKSYFFKSHFVIGNFTPL